MWERTWTAGSACRSAAWHATAWEDCSSSSHLRDAEHASSFICLPSLRVNRQRRRLAGPVVRRCLANGAASAFRGFRVGFDQSKNATDLDSGNLEEGRMELAARRGVERFDQLDRARFVRRLVQTRAHAVYGLSKRSQL